jgi:hypothetical protein
VKCDATSPQAKGPKLVDHVRNDIGGWATASCWPYLVGGPSRNVDSRAWHRGRVGNDFGLGAVRVVQARPDIWVANMVAQRGIKYVDARFLLGR